MNGILEIGNAEMGESMDRGAPFLPVKICYDNDAAKRKIGRLKTGLIIRGAKQNLTMGT